MNVPSFDRGRSVAAIRASQVLTRAIQGAEGGAGPTVSPIGLRRRIHWGHEVDIAPVGEIRAHGVCFRIWAKESEQLRKIA